MTLLFRPSPPDNQNSNLFQDSEKYGLFGIISDDEVGLQPYGPHPDWYVETVTPGVGFQPQADVIRRELDPLVQAFGAGCLTAAHLRHLGRLGSGESAHLIRRDLGCSHGEEISQGNYRLEAASGRDVAG